MNNTAHTSRFELWLDELPALVEAAVPYRQELEGAPAELKWRQRRALRKAGVGWAHTELGWLDRLDRVVNPDAPRIKTGGYELIPADWTYPRTRDRDQEIRALFLACHLYVVAFERGVRLIQPDDQGLWGFICRWQRRLFPSQRGFFSPTSFSGPIVSVNPELDPLEKTRTLCHELAHARLHFPITRAWRSMGRREVEAEVVTWLCLRAWGLDDERELRYLHTWDEQLKHLGRLDRERVLAVAGELVGQPLTDERERQTETALAAA